MLQFYGISRRDGGDHDGIHLIWSPPYPTGHALRGFTIHRRISNDQERSDCFEISPAEFEMARTQGYVDIVEARIWASPTNQDNPDKKPWTYRIELRDVHHDLWLNSSDAIAAFAARADGTVVEGRSFVGNSCRLSGPSISILWVVTPTPKLPFRICFEKVDPKDWENADKIVSDLQVPFHVVNPNTPDVAAEKNLAFSRAQPDPLDGDFSEVSRYGNAAYRKAFGATAFHTTTHEPDADRSNWDITPLGFVLAATAVDPAWRRALGFGFLDKLDLTDGMAYDYRISGHVPRADRDEPRHDFHTVPRGQSLPCEFSLGDLNLICLAEPVVEVERENGVPTPLWKGIRCDEFRLILPVPTTRIAMDGKSDGALELLGLMNLVPVATIVEPLNGRTVFDFGSPVNEVIVKGSGFFTGFMPRPLAPGLDPEEPVEVSETIKRIRFQPTAPPDPPTNVEAINLGSALRNARRQQRDDTIGFEVSWLPPLRLDSAVLDWWPEDAMTAQPSDVAGYKFERRWDGQPFAPPQATGGLHLPSRNADPRTEPLTAGSDLLAVYPPANATGIARVSEVLAIDAFEDAPPPFGTEVTYGISSVDAIGRASTRALAPPARLEKRIRPPVPIAPPRSAVVGDTDDDLISPSGVQIRLLQASDPDLTPAERAQVDTAGDLVMLKWGWGPQQRELDPHVKEFRIYEAEGRLSEITATIIGAPVALGSGGWRLNCSFSRPVSVNEFAGTMVVLGLAYEITAHATGSSGALDLGPAINKPDRSPVGTVMTLIRIDGSAEDPEAWDTRLRVVPRAPLPEPPVNPDDETQTIEAYEIVLPATWISVSPGNRRQIRSFGVSAADHEAYISDRRAAIETILLPGNEGPVSGGEVVARYRGRPSLLIADLGPISSINLDRSSANEVHLNFTPSAHLPDTAPAPEPLMRIERAPASAVLPRLAVDTTGIGLLDAAGVKTPWILSPGDDAALRAQVADREISDRFLAHAAARLTDIDDKFQIVAETNPSNQVRDILPNSTGRWIYRLRALDAGRRASAEGQVLQLVVRIPQRVRAVLPELANLVLTDGTATVDLRVRTPGARIFLVTSNDTRVAVAKAEMSTIRNRPDLDIGDRFIVRDDRGTLLTTIEVTPDDAGEVASTFTVPDRSHFHVWAYAVSPDDVPSRLVGPLHAFRGYPVESA